MLHCVHCGPGCRSEKKRGNRGWQGWRVGRFVGGTDRFRGDTCYPIHLWPSNTLSCAFSEKRNVDIHLDGLLNCTVISETFSQQGVNVIVPASQRVVVIFASFAITGNSLKHPCCYCLWDMWATHCETCCSSVTWINKGFSGSSKCGPLYCIRTLHWRESSTAGQMPLWIPCKMRG